jgi:opacity protein-like surface antigen
MKKLILLSSMMLLCLPLAAYGAGIGGPTTGGQFKFNIGLEQDVVVDRDFKPTSIVVPVIIDNQTVGDCDIRHMYRTMLNFSFGVFDFLDVYVKLGGAGFKFRTDFEDQFGNPEGNAVVHTKMGFAYGGGLKGAYEFKEGPLKGLLIGADAQYLRHRQRYHAMIDSIMGPSDATGHVTLQEWQAGPFVGYKIMNFLPYVGVKYSDVRLKFKEAGETTKFKAEDHVGTFVGLTYDVIPQLKLNLEGRFIDEYGVNFNVIFKF